MPNLKRLMYIHYRGQFLLESRLRFACPQQLNSHFSLTAHRTALLYTDKLTGAATNIELIYYYNWRVDINL